MNGKIKKSFEIEEGGSRFRLSEKDAGNWQLTITSDTASLQDIAETICNIINGAYDEVNGEKIKRLHFEFKIRAGKYQTEFFDLGCSIQDILKRLAPLVWVSC